MFVPVCKVAKGFKYEDDAGKPKNSEQCNQLN